MTAHVLDAASGWVQPLRFLGQISARTEFRRSRSIGTLGSLTQQTGFHPSAKLMSVEVITRQLMQEDRYLVGVMALSV